MKSREGRQRNNAAVDNERNKQPKRHKNNRVKKTLREARPCWMDCTEECFVLAHLDDVKYIFFHDFSAFNE